MRNSLIAAAALLLSAACADAPITAADIQANGQLRDPASQQSVHATQKSPAPAQRAERLLVTGLVASQADGALEDATRFSSANEAIYLHLRADDISEPRPVTFVWTHDGAWGEHRRETMGFLQPSETVTLAASLPIARYVEDAAEDAANTDTSVPAVPVIDVAGDWKVEVYSSDASGRSLVFEREFEVLTAERYDAMVAELMVHADMAGVAH